MYSIIQGKSKDLGGFSVKRIIPQTGRRTVGPFVFIDHMGPAQFAAGDGINVRPHPHIGLATLTYLFTGQMLHQDSLGSIQEIIPGDVNWMVAGSGIVHSERETIEVRSQPHAMNGLQCWVALPPEQADIAPAFTHVAAASLPSYYHEGIAARIILGEAWGYQAPAQTYSPVFFIDVLMQSGSTMKLPHPQYETGLYVVDGIVELAQQSFSQGSFIFIEGEYEISAEENARVVVLGGATLPQQPLLDWNFVAYERATIEAAIQRWRQGEFDTIPTDYAESIPYPG